MCVAVVLICGEQIEHQMPLCTAATAGFWCALYSLEQRTHKECETSIRDVKRTSKFIFEFGILTFDIRVKFALEQMWALKCLWTRGDVFVLCRRLTPPLHQLIAVASADAVGVWLPLPPRSIPLVLPSVYLTPLIWPPPPPSLLGNYVTYSTLPRLYSACCWRRCAALLYVNALLFVT